MKNRFRLALAVPLEADFYRRAISGVLLFASGRWDIRQFNPQDISTIRAFEPKGIIGAITDAEKLKTIRPAAPYVDISGLAGENIPRITSDHRAIGELAAAHLLDRGFGHFAYVSDGKQPDARLEGFRARLSVLGVDCTVLNQHDPNLTSHITKLKRPAGIFACDDPTAREILDLCHAASLRVPEDIAVLGCGDDDLICRMASPALSSVAVPAERIGYEAAKMLEEIAEGGSPAQTITLPVSSVATRRSTDVISIPDRDIAKAVRFIRAHAGEWIGVREVILAVGINRRSLERKFRHHVGRSPLEEIRRIRMEIAKDLLSRTDLSMPIVARRAGFSEGKQLSTMFREELDITPTDYRRRFRIEAEPTSQPTEGE